MGPSSAIRLTRCDQRTTDVLVRQFNLYGTRLTHRPTNIVSLTQTQLWVPELCGEFGRGMAWPPTSDTGFHPTASVRSENECRTGHARSDRAKAVGLS